jgi:hypothetical protein
MFLTIYRATYTSELLIIKSRLESEDISCLILDENTLNSYPMYSHAIGGARLQVEEKDFMKAKDILLDLGYPIQEIQEKENWLDRVNQLVFKIPFFQKMQIEKRLLLFFILIILIVFFLTYIINHL